MSDDEAEAVENVGEEMCVKDAGLLKMWETLDRPGKALAVGAYSGTGSFGDDGVYAAAGVGYARAEWGVFHAQAKGPNTSAGIRASVASGVKAGVKAEVASASVTAGPVKATVGLALDTGLSIGWKGLEVKLLGTGFNIGPDMSVSLFGSSVELNL